MSALKMEHLVHATFGGVVREITVSVGDTVYEDHPLIFVQPADVGDAIVEPDKEIDLDYIRPDLQALFDRRAFGHDVNRPAAVERRHSRNRRTVRENIEMLIDPGTWIEYGELAIAGQRRKRPLEELIPQDACRRPGRRRGLGQRGALRRRPQPRRLHLVRRHRVRRHAGNERASQDRPHGRPRLRAVAAGHLPRRGGRRPLRRNGRFRGMRLRRRRAHLGQDVPPQRHGADDRHHRRLVLRRQRGDPGRHRSHHRDRGRAHRDGRPRHHRGRRHGRLPARGGRADLRHRAGPAPSTSWSRTRTRRS